MVDLVLVLPIPQGSFLLSEMYAGYLDILAYCYFQKTSKLIKFFVVTIFFVVGRNTSVSVVNLDNGTNV